MKINLMLSLLLVMLMIPGFGWSGSRQGELGFSLDMQFDNVTMGDFNNSLNNQGYSTLSSGSVSGLGLTYGFTPNLEVGLSYDSLDAYSSTYSVFGHGSWSNYTVDLPLNELQLKVGYVFLDVMRHMDLKANIGVAYETMYGWDSSNVPYFWGTNFNANGLGMLYSAGAEFFIFPNTSLGVDVGYREANLNPVNMSGANSGNLKSASGSIASADFSGVFTKLSLNVYFGPPMDKPVVLRRAPQYELRPYNGGIQPQSSPEQEETVIINVPNSNGSYTPVKLTKHGQGYTGPQGEYYESYPSVEQLKVLY